MLAPIVLFTYNRLFHTQCTVEALSKNILAKESKLFIYSDAANCDEDIFKVAEVRNYLKTIKGFKDIKIIEQATNQGLPESISSAVTKIVNEFGKIIVIEDDIVTSPYFLTFMNDALNYYESNKKIWHISGWNFPLDTEGLEDTFLWRAAQVWGWGTWKDRWQHYKKDPDDLISRYSDYDIYKFNLDDVMPRWENEVIRNRDGALNTWAVFWYAAIFEHNGLCLQPSQTFVENIGRDGTGTTNGHDLSNLFLSKELCNRKVEFTDDLFENDVALYKIKTFWKKISTRNVKYTFSRNYNLLIEQINTMKKQNNQYVIYGAGRIAQLIVSLIPNNIDYIIDSDERKHNRTLNNKKIYPISALNQSEVKIIISVLGREEEIKSSLIENHQILKDRMICFKCL